MNNKLLVLITIIFFHFTFLNAQTSGIATYSTKSSIDLIEELAKMSEDEEKKKFYLDLKKEASKANEFISKLKFNQNESLFFFEDFLESDDMNKLDFAFISVKHTGKIYTNINEDNILTQKDVHGGNLIIKKKASTIKWKLENETKKIGEYKCYKATTKQRVYRSSGNHKEKTIEAWYAPSLTINSGPLGFGGLPGLIIELNDGQVLYTLKEIKFDRKDSKKTKVKKPTKGKIVTEDQFYEITSEARQRNGRDRN